MSPTQTDIKSFTSHARVTTLGPPSEEEIESAEQRLNKRFPDLIRWWISNFGVVDIERPTKGRPHLLLLGLGRGSTIDDNISLFNRPNPTLPDSYLVFAHEFDGTTDHIFALDSSGAVFRNSGFLFPSAQYTDEYSTSIFEWEYAFQNIDSFWSSRVNFYLEN